MKTTFSVLSILTLVFFILTPWPKLDLQNSTFVTKCNTALSAGGSDFDIIDSYPGSAVAIVGIGTSTHYYYANENSDVVAKLICAQGTLPSNPTQFYQDAVNSPQYGQIALGAPNYSITLYKRYTTPSWGYMLEEFGVTVVVWAIVLCVAFFTRKK